MPFKVGLGLNEILFILFILFIFWLIERYSEAINVCFCYITMCNIQLYGLVYPIFINIISIYWCSATVLRSSYTVLHKSNCMKLDTILISTQLACFLRPSAHDAIIYENAYMKNWIFPTYMFDSISYGIERNIFHNPRVF